MEKDSSSSRSSTGNNEETSLVSPESLWLDYFPYDSPYDQQKTGIKRVLKTTGEGGFTLIEGECGTGKTLLALCASLALIRSPDTDFKRILILTKVKQQLKAFENDLQDINQALRNSKGQSNFTSPVTSTTMVGKSDVCPYGYTDHVDENNVQSVCQQLQAGTDAVIYQYDDHADQLNAAEKLTTAAVKDKEAVPESIDVSDPETHPYPDIPPSVGGTNYCPYYAQFRYDQITDVEPFDYKDQILTVDTITNRSLRQGTCPHEAKGTISEDTEIAIGNYYHAFDPRTARSLPDELQDDSTILICDEAHTLVTKARDIFSETAYLGDLPAALAELEQVISWSNSGGERGQAVDDILDSARVSYKGLVEFRDLLDSIVDCIEPALKRAIRQHSEYEFSEATSITADQARAILDTEVNADTPPFRIPLEPPENMESDCLSNRLRLKGVIPEDDEETEAAPPWVYAEGVQFVVNQAHREIDQSGLSSRSSGGDAIDRVAPFVKRWFAHTPRTHFRSCHIPGGSEFRVGMTNRTSLLPELDAEVPVQLQVKASLPRQLGSTLDEFGGGICMSATMEPMFVFKQSIGLSHLDRPISTASFGLPFPKSNRSLVGVPLPKYTADNRGKAQVQAQYFEAIKDVVTTTPGNVLIVGPTYGAAEYMGERLSQDDTVEKPVLIDDSDGKANTDARLEQFLSSGSKALVTGAMGTLTEGVDYEGDKLHGVVVFGIPLEGTPGPAREARCTAYQEQFDLDSWWEGHHYGFTIPAVHRTRQALGRVIRSTDDVGVQVLLDERYLEGQAKTRLSDRERRELNNVDPANLHSELEAFWERR